MVAAIQSYNGASGMHLSHIELKVYNNGTLLSMCYCAHIPVPGFMEAVCFFV